MNLFLILRLKLIISTDSFTNNVEQFPWITPCQSCNKWNLTKINLDEQLISKLIVTLNFNEPHGLDGLSIRILQMGSGSISKPFSIIFRNSLKASYFPAAWKTANVVPVHKNGNKEILNNYRPFALLPFCSKLFEKIIFDTIF